MSWFNPFSTIKPSATLATSATHKHSDDEKSQESRKSQANNILEKIIVTCWTPSGIPIKVEARDAEHAKFLVWANPNPKDKKL